MQLLEFIETVNLAAKPEAERAMLLCFYHYKENGETIYTMANISLWLEECNFNKPNASRLKDHLTKGMVNHFSYQKLLKGLSNLCLPCGRYWNAITALCG